MTDPLSLGFIGRNGAYPANEAGRHADVVLAIGARFDDRSASSWLPGYSWNFPHSKLIHVDVDPTSSAATIRPISRILADARTFLRQMLAELERRAPKRGDALKAWHADIKTWTGRVGRVHPAQLRHPRLADPARARGGRLPGGAARQRHPGLRRRRQPQLVHAVLEGAPAADHAQLVGLLRHGLRRRRRARRQARGARPARAWRSPATAASPWCRTCCARRWNTTSRWCG